MISNLIDVSKELVYLTEKSAEESFEDILKQAGYTVHVVTTQTEIEMFSLRGATIIVVDIAILDEVFMNLLMELQHKNKRLEYIVVAPPSYTEKFDGIEESTIFALLHCSPKNPFPLLVALRNLTRLLDAQHTIKRQQVELEKQDATITTVENQLNRALEDSWRSTEAKNQFLANMSHEIRTPMNGVIGLTMLLLRTNLTPKQRRYAETIRNSSDSLLNVIDDILDFSRIDAGSLNLQLINFQLDRTIEDLCEQFTPLAELKGLKLVTPNPASLPHAVQGDPGRIRQVLSNLIGNAIKFTDTGTITVQTNIEWETNNELFVKISIQDTGIGIPKAKIENLFNSFEQVDGTSARKHGGTGLGLAICNQLADLMGGSLGVTSQVGKGSEFWFTLQLKRSPHIPMLKPHDSTALQSKRLLVSDSNPIVRDLLREQAESWGINVTTSVDGQSTLRILEEAADSEHPFDFLTVDWHLHDMSGLNIAKLIKNNPDIRDTSLILLTTFPQRGHGELAHNAGFAGYLVKPIPGAQLRDCFLTLLQRPSSDQSLITRHSLYESKMARRPDSAKTPRLLVVEDNLVDQEVMVELATGLGCQVKSASNGQVAIDMHFQEPYDIILMDCMLPNLSGYDATKEIRARESSQSRHTPIIGVATNVLAGYREKCLIAGMDDCLAKPLTTHQLTSALENWFPLPQRTLSGQNDATTVESHHEPSISPIAKRSTRIVSLYLRELTSRIDEIRQAIQESDSNKLENAANNLKGVSLIIGAPRVVRLARDLQQAGALTLLDTAPEILESLIEESKRVTRELAPN